MAFPLDHVIIHLPDPRPASSALRGFGLRADVDQPVAGTGAGHTVYFFDNAYLELVWPVPGQTPFADAPAMHAQRRCAPDGWCPFGVSFRTPTPTTPVPLSTWPYAAPFLPQGAIPIPIATNSERADEPIIVVSLVSGRPDRRTDAPSLQHDRGLHEITFVHLRLPGAGPFSPELQATTQLTPISVSRDDDPLIVMEIDGGQAGRHHRFDPILPLQLSW